jgi:hypothetical protein
VAQRVFKTRAVVQPTARSVRLRRRSVKAILDAIGNPLGASRPSAQAPLVRSRPLNIASQRGQLSRDYRAARLRAAPNEAVGLLQPGLDSASLLDA